MSVAADDNQEQWRRMSRVFEAVLGMCHHIKDKGGTLTTSAI